MLGSRSLYAPYHRTEFTNVGYSTIRKTPITNNGKTTTELMALFYAFFSVAVKKKQ
jgi:hypothetical protein